MRTLISNLNVIRATRLGGILRNRFERISASVVDPVMMAVHYSDLHAVVWKPRDVRAALDPAADQTCPGSLRLRKQASWANVAFWHTATAGQVGATSDRMVISASEFAAG